MWTCLACPGLPWTWRGSRDLGDYPILPRSPVICLRFAFLRVNSRLEVLGFPGLPTCPGVPWVNCNLASFRNKTGVQAKRWNFKPNAGTKMWPIINHMGTVPAFPRFSETAFYACFCLTIRISGRSTPTDVFLGVPSVLAGSQQLEASGSHSIYGACSTVALIPH